jgi:hypothetical protein
MGWTPLIEAARTGSLDCVNALFEHKTKVPRTAAPRRARDAR